MVIVPVHAEHPDALHAWNRSRTGNEPEFWASVPSPQPAEASVVPDNAWEATGRQVDSAPLYHCRLYEVAAWTVHETVHSTRLFDELYLGTVVLHADGVGGTVTVEKDDDHAPQPDAFDARTWHWMYVPAGVARLAVTAVLASTAVQPLHVELLVDVRHWYWYAVAPATDVHLIGTDEAVGVPEALILGAAGVVAWSLHATQAVVPDALEARTCNP